MHTNITCNYYGELNLELPNSACLNHEELKSSAEKMNQFEQHNEKSLTRLFSESSFVIDCAQERFSSHGNLEAGLELTPLNLEEIKLIILDNLPDEKVQKDKEPDEKLILLNKEVNKYPFCRKDIKDFEKINIQKYIECQEFNESYLVIKPKVRFSKRNKLYSYLTLKAARGSALLFRGNRVKEYKPLPTKSLDSEILAVKSQLEYAKSKLLSVKHSEESPDFIKPGLTVSPNTKSNSTYSNEEYIPYTDNFEKFIDIPIGIDCTRNYIELESLKNNVALNRGLKDVPSFLGVYKILGTIGRGSHSKVMLCVNLMNGRLSVCKTISEKTISRIAWYRKPRYDGNINDVDSDNREAFFRFVKNEVSVFKRLREGHPNINGLFTYFLDQGIENLFLIFELCEYGVLMDISMRLPATPYSEYLACVYTRDITHGLEFIHSKHILHRDIKPGNVVLKASKVIYDQFKINRSRTGIAQISDFSSSEVFESYNFNRPSAVANWRLTPAFTPPEACLLGVGKLRGVPMDIWSLGITIYCITHGHVPWKDESVLELYNKIIHSNLEISPQLSAELKDFVLCILNKNPRKRASIRQIESHKWFNSVLSLQNR